MNLVMNLIFLVIPAIFIVIFLLRRVRNAFRVAIIIFTLAGLIGILGFEYFTNHQFRVFVDLRFNPAKEHILNNEPPLPLPTETVFAYRGGNNSCTYFSERNPEEILAYFKKLGEIDEQPGGSGEAKYTLTYSGHSYSITLREADLDKGSYLWIENIQPF